MKNITKEEFALLSLIYDISHDILTSKDFNFEFKRRCNIVTKNIDWIISKAYGKQTLEKFDEHKEDILNTLLMVMNGKFTLKDEPKANFDKDVFNVIKKGLKNPEIEEIKELKVKNILREIKDSGYMIVKIDK